MPSEEELIQTVFPDIPSLDIERVCRVLFHIATYLEETHHEEISTQGQKQQETAIDGMDINRVEY